MSKPKLECPSARHDMPRSKVLGVIEGVGSWPRLAYLDALHPVTDELLTLAGDLSPTRLFRFAAPCVESGCGHFDGQRCRLAQRVVDRLEPGVDELPDCALRPACRWWHEEGEAACLRCPIISTESDDRAVQADELRIAADPNTPV